MQRNVSATTLFFDGYEPDKVTAIYRFKGGEPETAGADLLRFLELDSNASSGSRRADMPYLAARYVAFLSELMRKEDASSVCDFLSVGVVPGYQMPTLPLPADSSTWPHRLAHEDFIYLVKETSIQVMNCNSATPEWMDLLNVVP